MENKLARFRSLGLLSALAALLLTLSACGGGHREEPAQLRVILHGAESQSELLEAARTWLIGKGVDVLYLQTDAKDIYNRSVLMLRTGDVDARDRMLELTGVEVWIWARQEKPAAPFDLYIGEDINNLMDTY